GAPLGTYTFIYADGRDARAEQNALDLAAEEVDQRALVKEARQERARVDAHHRHRDEEAGQRGEDDHGYVVERRHYHQRQCPRNDDDENAGESHHAQRLELLANLAGPKIGNDRRAAHGGDHQSGGNRREFSNVRHHGEAAQPVLAAGGLEEVPGLQRDDDPPAHPGEQQGDEVRRQDEAALIEELFPVEGSAGRAAQRRPEEQAQLADVGHGALRPPDHVATPAPESICHPTGGGSPILTVLYTPFPTMP